MADGALAPGERLPSVRRMAAEAGLSPATVATALGELRRRGVVVTEPRRGTRIGEGPPVGVPRLPLPVPPGARDLSLGNPDPALLPDLSTALHRVPTRSALYGQPQVLPELLALAQAQLSADGIPSEHLCVAGGALDAIERVVNAHLRPGDRVAVENPGYAALFDLLRAQGMALEPVAVDQRGMLPGALQAAVGEGARAVVITPRGQNPTGATLDAERARELSDVLSAASGTLVIEDDHLGPVAGSPLHTLVGGRERWASVRSVAKTLGPDLRLAMLAGDAQTVARVQGRQQCGPGWVSHIVQVIVLALLTDASVGELIARATHTYTRRRERLIGELDRLGMQAHTASGLNVWVPVADETAAVGALMQRGWVLAAGAPYRLAGSTPGIRVTTATLTEREARRLATDLVAVLAPGDFRRSG